MSCALIELGFCCQSRSEILIIIVGYCQNDFHVHLSVVGKLYGPFAGFLNGTVLVVLPVVCDGLIQRVVHVGG